MTKILVVEDEVDLREAIKIALEGAQFAVVTAENGETGVGVALAEKPDVILMDITMPKLSGNEAVEKLRKDPWGKDAKVIYLTANSDPKSVVEAVKSGSEEYIVKSNTSLKEIVDKVKQVHNGY